MSFLEAVSYSALVAALIVTVTWAAVLVRVWRVIASLRRLPHDAQPSGDNPPHVSVVLAARDEEGQVERAVRSLLAQEGVEIQIVAVDDGSSDRTHEILSRLAAGDGRLLVLSSAKLPNGWVAKNYALELGQGRAEGDYLLFTDADVVHGRRALLNAVRVMQAEQLDHLAIHPRLEATTLIEAVVLPLFFLLAEFRFIDARASRPDSGVGAGIGAFNLVRAEAYRLRGTHARIRGAMLDDRALGMMMRDDRGRGSVMRAVTQVRMRPYRTLGDLYVGIRKEVLSAFGNRASVAFLMGLLLLFAALAPPILLVGGAPLAFFGHVPWGSIVALVSIALPIAGLLRARSMVKFEPLAALLFPIGALVISAATIHAALVFGARGTVEWRGRQYSRADLTKTL